MYSQQEEGAPHHAALDVVILHVEAHLAADEPACLGISHSCYGGNIKVVKFDVMKNVIKLEMNRREVWSFTNREKSAIRAFFLLKEATATFKNEDTMLNWR